MSVEELRDWFDQAYADAARVYAPEAPDRWWPGPGRDGQGQATTWAWATVMRAALARYPEHAKLSLSVNMHGENHRDERTKLRERVWGAHEYHSYEILLDYTVHDWNASAPVLLTAESEMATDHGVGDSITLADDYSWDFYKLLMVGSPLRLMLARVGSTDVESGVARRDKLTASLTNLLRWYGGALAGNGAEVGFVLLPEGYRDDDPWNDLRVLWWKGGDVAPRELRPWAHLPL
ncbi:MAG: hypothetical protein ACOZNI_30720 [Myxococcota bacterium]